MLLQSVDGLLVPIYCVEAGDFRVGDDCLDLVDPHTAARTIEGEPVLLGPRGQLYCRGAGLLSGFRSEPEPFMEAIWPATEAQAWDPRDLDPVALADRAALAGEGLCDASADCDATAGSRFTADLDGDVVDDRLFLTSERGVSVGYHDGPIYWASGHPGDEPRRLGALSQGAIAARRGVAAGDLDGDGAREVMLRVNVEGVVGEYDLTSSEYVVVVISGGEVAGDSLVSCLEPSAALPPDASAGASSVWSDASAPPASPASGALGPLLMHTGGPIDIWSVVGAESESGSYEPFAHDTPAMGFSGHSSTGHVSEHGSIGYGNSDRPDDPPARPASVLTPLEPDSPDVGAVHAALATGSLSGDCYVAPESGSPSAILALTLDRTGRVLGARLEDSTYAAEVDRCIERSVRSGVYLPIAADFQTFRFRLEYSTAP